MKTLLLAVPVVAACGNAAPLASPDASTPIDAAIDAAPAARCRSGNAFGPPTLVPGVNTASSEPYAWLSPDELEIHFTSDRPGSDGYDVYRASRSSRSEAFGAVTRLATVSTTEDDLRPAITPDGLTMFAFVTLHDGDSTELVRATRSTPTSEFGAFTMVLELNSAEEDEDPYVVDDGRALLFASHRDGDPDLYRATRTNVAEAFEAPAPIAELNTPATEIVPVASSDGLELFFGSDRAGGAGGLDIWSARRTTTLDGYGAATVVSSLGTTASDTPVWLSEDGCRLYFVSKDRTGGAGDRDLWVADRTVLE